MRRLLENGKFLLVLRLMVGGVFVYAGINKITEPLSFADSIATYQLVPRWSVNFIALGLPLAEVIVGSLLILGWRQRLAAFCLLVFTLIFCLALAQGITRGLEIDCGCFGGGESSIKRTLTALGRDMLLLLATGWIYVRRQPGK
jgi:uncharacterized membrane protein YphA (DoxX/SURF4 family)